MKFFGIIIAFCSGIILLGGCDKGEALPNQKPETTIFLDNIALTGEDRLTSVVRIFWSGTDRDGYVQGFEISFDEQEWSFTENYDSTFRFVLGQGSDTVGQPNSTATCVIL